MECKIVKTNEFTDKQGKTFRTYKVFIENEGYWISTKDFEDFPGLLNISAENIVLQEPVKEKYARIFMRSTKGEYLVLEPIEKILATDLNTNPDEARKLFFDVCYETAIQLYKTKVGIEYLTNDEKSKESFEEQGIPAEKIALHKQYAIFVEIAQIRKFRQIIDKTIRATASNQSKRSSFLASIYMCNSIISKSLDYLKNKLQFDESVLPEYINISLTDVSKLVTVENHNTDDQEKTVLEIQKQIEENEQTPQSEKVMFINTLLDFSTRKKTDTKNIKQLQKLITKEFESNETNDNEIKEKVIKLEKRVDKLENKKVDGGKEVKNLPFLQHKPDETAALIKKFKYDNSSGFKELVHKPTQSSYTIRDYEKNLENASVSFFELKNIPIGLYKSIEELISLMHNEGLDCVKRTNEHPYLNSKCKIIEESQLVKYSSLINRKQYKTATITNIIQKFKQNYRFDTEESEATNLRKLIIKKLSECFFENNGKKIVYQNYEDISHTTVLNFSFSINFDSLAIFFTWVPNIERFIKDILDDILKHGNIKGKNKFKSGQKNVSFCIDRVNDDLTGYTKIIFEIHDSESIVKKNPTEFFKQIREKGNNLKSLCDWTIEADFDNRSSNRLRLLPEPELNNIELLPNKVGGLKHILTFYEV